MNKSRGMRAAGACGTKDMGCYYTCRVLMGQPERKNTFAGLKVHEKTTCIEKSLRHAGKRTVYWINMAQDWDN
jgi:hypothetical protein